MSAIFGETLLIEQANGPDIELVVWGDEFYVRYETTDGYTVCYDELAGRFCYADLHQGRLISTGAAADKNPPFGIRRHLQESTDVQQVRFDARYTELRPEDQVIALSDNTLFTLGPNDGLLNGRRVSDGTVLGLTILVEFSDVRAAVDADDVRAMLNDDNYTTNGNFCSVREYYSLMSNGLLDYSNHVVGPIRLPHNRRHYETHSIVPEAFALSMAQLDADGFDLTQLDSRNEGIIDALSFMYAGSTVYGVNGNNNNPSELWPHNSVRIMNHGNLRTHFYMISSMGRRAVDLSIGTYCHEIGHQLCRFPDLYDYGRRDGDNRPSRGMGRYCLMSGGNHLDRGRTPSPISAFLRDLVGWTPNEVLLNGPGQHSASHGDYGTVMKYTTSAPNEYFIIENRSRLGLDEHLPSSGLAIYHCDTNGSNEWQDGTAARHYQMALLQADGRLDLESNRPGDNDDLFDAVAGIALSHQTTPSSRQWDGSDSGLEVSEISAPGQSIDFSVGQPVQPSSHVSREITAHLLIPDDDDNGVSSSTMLTETGQLTDLSVHVDITHSYIGDLVVSLISPAGTAVVLHNRSGNTADDIRFTYNRDNTAGLSTLDDESITGQWSLHIADMEGADVGRLNRWTLDIDYASQNQMTDGDSSPDQAIPDDDTTGISDTITIGESGTLTEINISVDITHTYIGDLLVELAAPGGELVVLHNRSGEFRNDLKLIYDRSLVASLDLLTGVDINGDWTLRIRDLEGADTGTLNSWGITLLYSPS